MGNSDARSRIRKAAQLQREKEARQEEAKKVARQKEKLARQKQRTDELLGRKLSKLDARNGDNGRRNEVEADNKSMGSRGLDGSSNHGGDKRRSHGRRRRTHLSHNILVRNMNQMSQDHSEENHDEDQMVVYEEEEEDDDMTLEADNLNHSSNLHSSSASLGSSEQRRQAYQRRLDRQRN